MKPTNLNLTIPTYEDMMVIELRGEYNDNDYLHSTIKITPKAYNVLMPILKSVTGSRWQDADLEDKSFEAIKALGYDQDSDMFGDMFLEVFGPMRDIKLDGDYGDCYTMEILAVHFECADDNIRYEVAF